MEAHPCALHTPAQRVSCEWEDIVCLFDYAEGELPEIDRDKRLCVFASHHHSDHFNPEIFTRFADHPRHTFILSDDIRTVPAGEKAPVVRTGPNCRRIFPGGKRGAMSVSTIGSTDCGVAFVVNYAGKTVYHAGDLHWWAWPDDTPEEERDMKNCYFAEIAQAQRRPAGCGVSSARPASRRKLLDGL